jgi:hypothetical protein
MRRESDWLADLARDGDWRTVADWLQRHNTYLAPGMADFARNMHRSRRQPTPRQFTLLLQLRAGVEVLMRWEQLIDGAGTGWADDARLRLH